MVWRHLDRVIVVGLATVLIAMVNLHAYIDDYLPDLPYGNTPIARAITDYTDQFAANVTIAVVGTEWRDGMPGFKSIIYPARHPMRYAEIDPLDFDCDDLSRMQRPALVIWSPDDDFPALLDDCRIELADQGLIATKAGLSLFHVASVA